ncbi:hypothetical protein HAX54_027417, partial [Datura stramonium]|nr:hypothetical protein [Datura stramonium]
LGVKLQATGNTLRFIGTSRFRIGKSPVLCQFRVHLLSSLLETSSSLGFHSSPPASYL